MISGVVLARNESENIVACLKSLGPHVHDITLIDMASTDGTAELAQPFVNRVISHPLIPNFDTARNVAISVAQCDWIWFLDADERIPDETGRLVNELVRERGDEFVALTIPFKTYFCGKWIEHCGWWPGYTMPRVLKRGHFQFGTELHSGVQFNGPELRFPPRDDLAIQHFSYRSVEHYIEKLNRYTSTEALNRYTKGDLLDWKRGIREMVRDLWLYYERNAGAMDGYRGWILSWLSGQYRWLTEAKLIDYLTDQTSVQDATAPADLDEVMLVVQQELSSLRGYNLSCPLPLTLSSPLRDASGYADDGRAILKAIALLDRATAAREIRWSEKRIELPPADAGLLNTMLRIKHSQGITVTNCIPTLCAPDDGALVNVLRTTFETDRIPAEWLHRLERFDEIWVPSLHNQWSFRRAGVAPEKLFVVSQAVDTAIFSPDGSKLVLPPQLSGRFVFLSVLDWQLRKGWDVLLRSYCSEFGPGDGVGLLLKVSRQHGHTPFMVQSQAEQIISQIGQSMTARNDIVFWDACLPTTDLAALYRSVDAFVLASRGEGCGRPYLEAMASGLPTIGTRGSGNDDFMSDANSFLVRTEASPVSAEASAEINVYSGHWWREPDGQHLRQVLREVFSQEQRRMEVAQKAVDDVRKWHSVPALAMRVQARVEEIECVLRPRPTPLSEPGSIKLELEGEFFAGHSFSNINEELAKQWSESTNFDLSLKRVQQHPTVRDSRLETRLAPYFDRAFPDGADLTIRHAFPPCWQRPERGKWVHIQPWEFGYLPLDWIEPLKQEVDEIWAPSTYVREVYIRSGVPSEKVHVIPWGIDPTVYRPDAPDLLLPTPKTFRFLFVGGTIPRKGFDLVLEAYLKEFSRHEDVCLVVKDVGTSTFYRFGNLRDHILEAVGNPDAPWIVYRDDEMTEGQRASLYTACQCLVAPYRGEGFGLPVLEAMACGLPPIVPIGGPTDDFTSLQTAYLLPAINEHCGHDWQLCGPPTQLSIRVDDLREAMRAAYTDRLDAGRRGKAAAEVVRSEFTWTHAMRRMQKRIDVLMQKPASRIAVQAGSKQSIASKRPRLDLTACVAVRSSETIIANCLSRLVGLTQQILVADLGADDRTIAVAKEYGANIVECRSPSRDDAKTWLLAMATSSWTMFLEPHECLSESDCNEIESLLAHTDLSSDHLEFIPSFRSAPLELIRNLDRSAVPHLSQQAAIRSLLAGDTDKSSKTAPSVSSRQGKSLSIGVITIGYNLPGATRALIESAVVGCEHTVTFLVISHAHRIEKRQELDDLAKRSDVVYQNYGTNRGLARSWNDGILWGFESNHDVVLIVNEDVIFAPGDISRLAESAFEQPEKFLVMGRCYHENEQSWAWSEYGCFAFNRLALDTLGCFDENFFPVYCEDSDFRRRALLAGLEVGYCDHTSIRHAGSASLAQADVARQNQLTYARNRNYFSAKWGGDAGQEQFATPFNDPRFSSYIDPRVRQAPYPGHNRSDHDIVQL